MARQDPLWEVQQNAPLRQLFQAIDKKTPNKPVVGKGSIISFAYVGQTRRPIHDPYPLAIVTDVFNDMIRAVNLHYLTLPYVRNLVLSYANNPQFSFAFIKGDAYIVGAFRSYKRNGISQLKALDADFLRNLLTAVRALDPGEIEQMREQIHQMLAKQVSQINQPLAQPGEEQ